MTVAMMVSGHGTAHKLDAVAWGLFFIWIGVAFLANLSWGIGLLGVGVLILGMQTARKYMAFTSEMFWVAVGLLFLLGGVWELLGVHVSLIPVVCIVAGIALLISALPQNAKE